MAYGSEKLALENSPVNDSVEILDRGRPKGESRASHSIRLAILAFAVSISACVSGGNPVVNLTGQVDDFDSLRADILKKNDDSAFRFRLRLQKDPLCWNKSADGVSIIRRCLVKFDPEEKGDKVYSPIRLL